MGEATLLPPLNERGLKRSICKLFTYALLTHTFTFIYFFNLRFFPLDFINGTEKVGEVEERGREQRARVPQSAWAPGLQIRLELPGPDATLGKRVPEPRLGDSEEIAD